MHSTIPSEKPSEKLSKKPSDTSLTSTTVTPLTSAFDNYITQKINNKTKPLGALGDLELLAAQLAKIQYQARGKFATNDTAGSTTAPENQVAVTSGPLIITKPTLIVFAGDHGIGAEGVSIAPSEVTGQMVANFAHGGAAINVFCQQFGWQLQVVDTGILQAPQESLNIIDQRLGAGTKAFHTEAAMSVNAVDKGFNLAKQLIKQHKQTGCNVIGFGEMGIANTSAAAAILSIITGENAQKTVGKGTGVTDDIVVKKQQLITQALALHEPALKHAKAHSNEQYVKQILACVGGYEIVQLTGAMLAAAEQNMMIVIDGFICTAAAMLASMIDENVKGYMVFAHTSGEQGHQQMLDWLNAKPLLNLGLRLGEGSGAALALPLLQAATAFYNDMASFSQAEVTDVIN